MNYVSAFLQFSQLLVLIYIARKEYVNLPFVAQTSAPPAPRRNFKPFAKPDTSAKRKPFAHEDEDLYAREKQQLHANN